MKRLKFLLLTVVCVAVLFCVATVTASADVVASGNCGENITYTLDSDGTLTISGTGHMPDYWTTLPWDSYLSAIKEVYIESGVTSVGSNAFANCIALTSVVISEGVKSIGDGSFSACSSLLSVDIPSSLTYVCWNAFGGCSSLNAVYISDIDAWCNTEFNSEWSNPLYYANNLYLNGTLVTELTIPYDTTKINAYSFCGCSSLESVTIENEECQIAYNENAIPSSATIYGHGGSSAEAYAKLFNRNFVSIGESANKIVDVGFINDGLVWILNSKGTLTISGIGSIPDYYNESSIPWYSYCSNIRNVVIEEGVSSIGGWAFDGCSSLKSISIPESITSIGWNAFYDCISLTNVHITDLEKWLKISFDSSSANPCYNGADLYLDGELLTDIIIPPSVKNLKNHAFYGCTSITNITISDGITTIGMSTFMLCSSLKCIDIPDSVTSIGTHAFSCCSSLENIDIPDGVTSIGESTFYNCSSLVNIKIPINVISIGEDAFAYCSKLVSIDIPDNVTSIGSRSFLNCSVLKFIKIPNSVFFVSRHAFAGCNNLSSVILGDNVTSIDEYAFAWCDNLQSVGYTKDVEMKENIVIEANNEKLVNAKWYYNVCNAEHTYSGDCDESCNVCEFPRTVNVSHTYTNTCDDTCNICGYITAITHTFTDDCDSVCNICSFEREITYDYTITTDEDITLSYSTTANVRFVVSDESIAHITGTGMSSVVIGSYVSKKVSATITPKKPGGVIVSVVDSYNNVLAKSLLLVVEGEHQFELSKTISVRGCVTPGKAVYVCKFCAFEKEEYEEAYGHSYSYGCDAICNRCDFVRTDISHDNTKSVAEVKATCTTKGSTAGVYCNDCKKYISGHKEIPVNANAHKWDNGKITTTATCKISGVKTYTCQHNASHKKTENLGINASNHVNTKNVPETPATFENVGYTAGVYCDDCKKYISGHTEIPKLVPEFADSKDAKESGNNIVSNNGLTVAQLLSQAGKGAVIKTADGKAVGNTALIGTGMILTLADGSKKEIVVYGDSDGDGKISAADARLALRASVKLESYKEDSCYYKAANVDKDALTAADARLILRASVGLEEPKDWMK